MSLGVCSVFKIESWKYINRSSFDKFETATRVVALKRIREWSRGFWIRILINFVHKTRQTLIDSFISWNAIFKTSPNLGTLYTITKHFSSWSRIWAHYLSNNHRLTQICDQGSNFTVRGHQKRANWPAIWAWPCRGARAQLVGGEIPTIQHREARGSVGPCALPPARLLWSGLGTVGVQVSVAPLHSGAAHVAWFAAEHCKSWGCLGEEREKERDGAREIRGREGKRERKFLQQLSSL